MNRWFRILAVGILFSAMIATAGVAAAGSSEEDTLSTTATIERTADGLRYVVTVDAPDDVRRLDIVVDGAQVVAASGFQRAVGGGDGEQTRLRYGGSGPGRVVLAVTESRQDRRVAAADAWAFGPVPFVEIQAVTDDGLRRSWPLSSVRPGGAGVVGDRYALVGQTRVYAATRTDGSIRIAVPAGTDTAEDPHRVAGELAAVGARLNVGGRTQAVVAFAVDGVGPGGESVPAGNELWVNADSDLDSAENVWFHEYVHLRQSFRLSEEMQWFREASAEYYAARLSYERGHISRGAMRANLDGEPSHATLSAPDTWANGQVPHRKGARVLAALDRRIRAATYGHQSLEGVFRRLNGHDGQITYAVFQQTVNEVAGRPMDAWLDRHVAGDAPVADGGASGPLATAPSHRPTAETFMTVALGFSIVVTIPLYGFLSLSRRRGRWTGTPAK